MAFYWTAFQEDLCMKYIPSFTLYIFSTSTFFFFFTSFRVKVICEFSVGINKETEIWRGKKTTTTRVVNVGMIKSSHGP